MSVQQYVHIVKEFILITKESKLQSVAPIMHIPHIPAKT